MGRAPCCDKNISLKKGSWTPEEDQKLIDYIQKHGHGSWRTLSESAGLERCGKSCRLRWANYLRPDIKRGRFSFEEEETIVQLHSVLGNKWSAIAARLPGRTDNEIKNYWNTHIRKRLLRMGIDPVTHTPRLDQLLDFSSVLGTPLCNTNQLNLTRLLGIQPLLNSQTLKLASNILSTSPVPQTDQYSDLLTQYCLEQNQVLHDNGALHLSNATSVVQTASIVSNLDQKQYFLDVNTQLLQPNNSDQLNPIDLAGCQIAQPNLWQQSDSNFNQTNSIPLTSDRPSINTFSGGRSNYQELIPSSSHQDFSFPLVASMPITSSTQTLNSSPTSINVGSGSTTPSSTCINGSYTELERVSGCNTVLSLDEFI